MPDAPEPTRTLRVSELHVGETLDCNIVGTDGVLLLARGRRIEPDLLEGLRRRGVEQVKLAASASAKPAAAPAVPEASLPVDIDLRVPPSEPLPPDAYELRAPPPPLPRVAEERFAKISAEVVDTMRSTVEAYDSLLPTFRAGRFCEGEAAIDLLLGLRRAGDADIDLMALMLLPTEARVPHGSIHAVRQAVVAMRLARAVSLGPDAVLDAGLVALFCDIGMSSVAEQLLSEPRRLSPTEWERVHRHCAASSDMTEKIRGLRPVIAHAVYQHHERPDGSGYPRGRSGSFLHPLARIASVADVFTAVMERREHRPARTPHHAVRATLEGVRAGRLDNAIVRALLSEVSLFPVGTPVRLTNNRHGWVYRTDAAASDRPVIAFDDGRKPRRIELALTPDQKIAAVETPAEAEAKAA